MEDSGRRESNKCKQQRIEIVARSAGRNVLPTLPSKTLLQCRLSGQTISTARAQQCSGLSPQRSIALTLRRTYNGSIWRRAKREHAHAQDKRAHAGRDRPHEAVPRRTRPKGCARRAHAGARQTARRAHEARRVCECGQVYVRVSRGQGLLRSCLGSLEWECRQRAASVADVADGTQSDRVSSNETRDDSPLQSEVA